MRKELDNNQMSEVNGGFWGCFDWLGWSNWFDHDSCGSHHDHWTRPPTRPVCPVEPDPCQPIDPCQPVDPCKPVDPCQPVDPCKPIKPNKPTKPSPVPPI